MTEKRWKIVGIAVAVVCVGLIALVISKIVGGGGGDAAVSIEPSVTVAASPKVTEDLGPRLRPGYLAVESLPASQVPWDQVGPGWFLVNWTEKSAPWPALNDENNLGPGGSYGVHPHEANDASVSLLSPDGTWYAAAALKSTGATQTMFWMGDKLALFAATEDFYEDYSNGDVSILDLRTGAVEGTLKGVKNPQWTAVAPGGTLIGKRYDYEDVAYYAYTGEPNGSRLCSGNSTSSLSPDATQVVCLGWEDAKTPVLLGRPGVAGGSERIGTLPFDSYRYEIHGWFDSDTLLMTGPGKYYDYNGPSKYFTYRLSTRSQSDYTLPFETGDYVRFDGQSQTYWAVGDGPVSFYARDGRQIAQVSCGDNYYGEVAFSGSYALVPCAEGTGGDRSTVALSLIDLASGATTEVARVDVENYPAGQGVQPIFGYPANL